MYAAGSVICHQRPERSFHLLGAQLPVCARCLGIYAGAALISRDRGRQAGLSRRRVSFGGAAPIARRAGGSRSSARTVLLIAALPTAATLLVEWTTGHTPGNWTRAVSGVPLGAAVAWIVVSGAKVNYSVVPATAAEHTQSSSLVLLCLASWAIPGAGHLWLGRRIEGADAAGGAAADVRHRPRPPRTAGSAAGDPRLFDLSEPLAGSDVLADLGIGALYFVASALGYGAGDVRAVTYEYGNAFLIVAGLLNLLVVIDAFDIAMGRK